MIILIGITIIIINNHIYHDYDHDIDHDQYHDYDHDIDHHTSGTYAVH